jgi:outer membrane protein TolC
MRRFIFFISVFAVFSLALANAPVPVEEQKSLFSILLQEMSENLRAPPVHTRENVFTLETCLKIAVEGSGKLHVAKEEYKLSTLQFKNARRDLFPKLDGKVEQIEGTTTGEDFEGRGTKLEMQYPLYTGGRASKQWRQAQLQMSIAQKKHDQIVLDVLTETEKAYYVWVEAKIRESSTKDLSKLAETAQDIMQKQHAKGMERPFDWQETQMLTTEIRQKIHAIQNDRWLAELSLRQLLEKYSPEGLDVPALEVYEPLTLESETLASRALETRPDIHLNRLLEKSRKLGHAIAKTESHLQILLDSFVGRRAENFVSEDLTFDNEYYVGITGKLPLGPNTLETQVITQDTVPSAGQTTSTQFTSYSVKFNLLDNKSKTTQLDELIKFYKAIEDSETLKKAAIFEIGKTMLEVWKAYDALLLYKEKRTLAEKKLEFAQLRMGKNEGTVNDTLREVLGLFDAKISYSKAILGYYTAVVDLNKALGKPGFFNPQTGTGGSGHEERMKPQENNDRQKWSWLPFFDSEEDPYLPTHSYEELRFQKRDSKKFFGLLGTEVQYMDPIEEKEKQNL